jgi:uncharacterized protein YcnI
MRIRRLRPLVLASVVVTTVALRASAAAAHVEVVPDSAPKGGSQILSFAVPNESNTANTTELEVTFPTKYPIATARTQPMPGWSASVATTTLTKPVKTDDGDVTEAVASITWTATDGGLKPGEFDLFTISTGPLPTKGNQVVFKAIQTYSDGEVVSWIQKTVKGAPEPEHPAPVLQLTAASGHDH